LQDQHVQEIKKKIDNYISPSIPEVGMYEMARNIFDSALTSKQAENLPQDRKFYKEEKYKEGGLERKEEKEANKLDFFSLISSKNKYSVPKPNAKNKKMVTQHRSDLYSQKLFGNALNDNIKKRSAKDTLLLPLINSEM